MTRRVAVAAVAVGLAACRHPAVAPSSAEGAASADAVARLEHLSARMCACEDAACAATVDQALLTWLTGSYGEVALTDPQLQVRDDEVSTYQACARRARAPRTEAQRAVAEYRDLEARMCACRDAACVKQVQFERASIAWRYRDTRVTAAQLEETARHELRASQCARSVVADPATPL